MGDEVKLADHRSRRDERARSRDSGHESPRPAFYFDLSSPFTYLAAERVERSFADVAWVAASGAIVRPGPVDIAKERAAASARAAALRLPLVWSERWPHPTPAALRAASYAIEQGRAAAFVLAACRLAWAGGFDIEDPMVLGEAAVAANLSYDATLEAARETSRDAALEAAGRRIAELGADRLPAMVVGSTLFAGEERMAEAAALVRHNSAAGA